PAGAHETVVATVVVLDVAGVPVLARRLRELTGARHPERTDEVALIVTVGGRRAAVVVEREAVTAAEHAEVVVKRVVLHHHDDDVVDLRQGVGAGGGLRMRGRPGRAGGLRPRWRRRLAQPRPSQPAPGGGPAPGGRA